LSWPVSDGFSLKQYLFEILKGDRNAKSENGANREYLVVSRQDKRVFKALRPDKHAVEDKYRRLSQPGNQGAY